MEEAFVKNAADEEQIKSAEKKIEYALDQASDDFLKIMKEIYGRRFILSLLKDCGVFKLSHSGEQTHETSFNEGQRNMGLKLMARINATCPELYSVMLQEDAPPVARKQRKK